MLISQGDNMTRIMFVCHGNICRSPMAEFLMKYIVDKKGLASEFFIDSSATSTEEIGDPVYPETKRILARHNISTNGKVAKQLKRADYDNFDYFLCMDRHNLRSAVRILDGDKDNKVSLLLDFTNNPRPVADPYYTGNFELTYNDIMEGIDALLEHINNK